MTIGNTQTNNKEVITKFNAALLKLPDVNIPLNADWYQKKVKELNESISSKTTELKKLANDIHALEKRIEGLKK